MLTDIIAVALIVAACIATAWYAPPRWMVRIVFALVIIIFLYAALSPRADAVSPSVLLVAQPSSGNASGAWVVVPDGIAWRTDRIFANGGEW